MRRLVFLLVAVGISIQPALADDIGARQADLRQQLAAEAQEISQLNLQMASLERSLTDTQQRIDRERAEVRILARALYAQPDSLVATVFESASISEALTRLADLTSAGDRAASTKRELDRDMIALSRQRAQLETDHEHQAQLQLQLEDQYGKLVQQAVAQRVQSPSAPPAPLPTDPASVAAIKQIILTAFAPLGAAGQTWAIRVAACESNYNPYAVNRYSGASGLFQFLPSTWASLPQHSQSVFDPTANALAAEVLYVRSGPNQWSCK